MTEAQLSRIVPALLTAAMGLGEAYANRRRRPEAERRDRGSLYAVYLLIGLGYWGAFGPWLTRHPPGPQLGVWAVWVGAAVALGGIALRRWSVQVLGEYFTYVVRVSPDPWSFATTSIVTGVAGGVVAESSTAVGVTVRWTVAVDVAPSASTIV